jgi:hypothetical protein
LTDSTKVLSLGGSGVELGTGEAGSVAVQAATTLNAPTTLVMHCDGPGLFASGSRLTAVRVGTLH